MTMFTEMKIDLPLIKEHMDSSLKCETFLSTSLLIFTSSLVASHALNVWSYEPDTILAPSGENATDVTQEVWP